MGGVINAKAGECTVPQIRPTSFVLNRRQHFVLAKVAQLRAFRGEPVPAGERSHSVSAVVRSMLDAHMPSLEAELRDAGLDVDAEIAKPA